MSGSPTNGEATARRPTALRASRKAVQLVDLSDRDLAILDSVAQHRYLSARQLQSLHFFDHSSDLSAARTCRRVLERLTEQRVLARLDRRIGGIRAGSASFVYQVGTRGRRLLRQQGRDDPLSRSHEPGLNFLDHHLAIGDLRVALGVAERSSPLTMATFQAEPACWRSYRGLGGQLAWVKPDAYVELERDAESTHWFLEVDRGTESIQTLIRKCHAYEGYLRSGIEQQCIGAFPYVCWSLPNERRVKQFEAALSRARDITVAAHHLVLTDDAARHIVETSVE